MGYADGWVPSCSSKFDTARTGEEHLFFYGRLKNLRGADLANAVEHALRSVSLWDKTVRPKLVREYSGGMKRRLSVAVSLIGSPAVVFLDEPSTVRRSAASGV